MSVRHERMKMRTIKTSTRLPLDLPPWKRRIYLPVRQRWLYYGLDVLKQIVN